MPLNPRNEAQKVWTHFWEPYVEVEDFFPVDPITICRKLGLEVFDTELPEDVSGALIKYVGEEPIIALHRYDNNKRKRFSCAHELGHYVFRSESNNNSPEYNYIDYRNADTSSGTNREEIFANQFAAHLLMPDEEVKRLHRKDKSHLEMASFFGVSVEALKHKLNALKLLNL